MVTRVAIIGAGGMGAWFARFFKSKRYTVTIADRSTQRARLLASRLRVKHAPSNIEAARGSGIVVLATPTNVTPRVIKEILPVLRRNALVCDISATKSGVMPALRSAQRRGIKVASIHPMFGPLAHGIRGRRILVVRMERDTHDYRTVKRLFRGARVHSADQAIHDKQMALTLGLPHLLNMAFAMTVSKRRNLAEIRRFAGRTFDLQMLLAEAIANEPETVADIQIMNREFPIVLRELQAEIQSLARMVNKRERPRLVARYRQLREALSADPEFRVARKMFERVSEAYSVVSRN